MNGYKKLLYEAERELEKCHAQMKANRAEGVEYRAWTRRAMEAEAVITFIKQRLEAQ